MIEAVLFDAAGTLFHPREPVGRSYARIAREYGPDAPEQSIAANFKRAFESAPGLAFGPGHPAAELRRLELGWWRELVAKTFAPLGPFPRFDAYFSALFAYFADPASWQADAEAEPVLKRLKDRGLKLGVASNFDFRLYRILEGLGLKHFFDAITISSEAGYAKPDPRLFREALAKLDAAPQRSMHVGDSERLDLSGAGDAGMVAVLIDPAVPTNQSIFGGRTAKIFSLALVPDVAIQFS